MNDRLATGKRFLTALTAHDYAGIETLFDPEVRFRGLTPNHTWGMFGAPSAIATMRGWVGEQGDVTFLESEAELIGDRVSLRYRYAQQKSEGPGRCICEQQAYATIEHGRVVDLAVLCSGPRPVDAVED
jgi:hypothetical protein